MQRKQQIDSSLKEGDNLTNDLTEIEDPKERESLTYDLPATESPPMSSNWRKDKWNILLLTFLYVLQGIPLGLAGTVPIMLQGLGVTYKQQAMFSFVYWPFAIKLLWAPIVDCFYVAPIGRRKSWLLPTQYLLGISMILLSYNVPYILGHSEAGTNIFLLTCYFFALNLLAATQDIAVDGWALTMLSKENVGFMSTCNTIGQTAGYFIAFTIFMALNSAKFCNTYLRVAPSESGIVDLPGFLYFWGIVFMIVTTLVGLLKHEQPENQTQKQGILEAYRQLYRITKLPAIRAYLLAIFTSKIAFATVDGVTGLKLMEGGLPKETIAFLGLAVVPIQIFLPAVISRFTAGPKPLNLLLRMYPIRLVLGLLFVFAVWWTPRVAMSGSFPPYYYIVIIIFFLLHQVTVYSMFVATMAFHARISDPAIGGTYMTLLNTVTNLAAQWSGTIVLWFVESLSYYSDCSGATSPSDDIALDCATTSQREQCVDAGGQCMTYVDGYYLEVLITMLLGILWLWSQSGRMDRLQSLDESHWKVGPISRSQ